MIKRLNGFSLAREGNFTFLVEASPEVNRMFSKRSFTFLAEAPPESKINFSKRSFTFLAEASPKPKMNFSKRSVEKVEKVEKLTTSSSHPSSYKGTVTFGIFIWHRLQHF